jgi:hypothetical protein
MSRNIKKPTKRMRSTAWRTLAAIADDPDAGSTARVNAARRLVQDDDEEAEAAEAAAVAYDGPRFLMIFPDNTRDPGLARLGISEDRTRILYDPSTPEGLAALEKWIAEVEAEAPQAPVEKAPPMTSAQRCVRYRARLKAAKLAAAA